MVTDLLEKLEKEVGKKCFCCGSVMVENDWEIIEDTQSTYPITEIFNKDEGVLSVCQECYSSLFEEKYFLGDYNYFHPNETISEFEEHEDFEPTD
jgi:heterodisulfide reductase subunit B